MSKLFGLVDCARDPELIQIVRRSPARACLFAGSLSPDVEAVAPHLVDLDASPVFAQTWRAKGWGKSWGVLLRSGSDLETLRRHFRRFLLAQMPDGRKVMMRFYDPRVLRSYLGTCTSHELTDWFGNVEIYLMEDETGFNILSFAFDGVNIRRSIMPMSGLSNTTLGRM